MELQSESLGGSVLGPMHIYCDCHLDIFEGLLESVGVSDSFAFFKDLFFNYCVAFPNLDMRVCCFGQHFRRPALF